MNQPETPVEPRWRPLSSVHRRVLGVLIEKAKTTPDAYPLSLNAVTTGCNQKSNRSPLMSLEPEDVEDALDQLRAVDPRHHQVGQDDVEVLALEQVEGIVRARGGEHLVALLDQHVLQEHPEVELVVDRENARFGHRPPNVRPIPRLAGP